MSEEIILSKRAQLTLRYEEIAKLRKYLKQPGSYTTITNSTNICYTTQKKLAKTGTAQVGTIEKIRKFLALI